MRLSHSAILARSNTGAGWLSTKASDSPLRLSAAAKLAPTRPPPTIMTSKFMVTIITWWPPGHGVAQHPVREGRRRLLPHQSVAHHRVATASFIYNRSPSRKTPQAERQDAHRPLS